MKKELRFEDLTHEQKLGMVLCTNVQPGFSENEVEKVLNMIREHRLGSVWVSRGAKGRNDILKKINEVADYPILIVGDAEQGYDQYQFPAARSLGATGYNEEMAYAYGRVVGYELRELGFNAMNGPVVDLSDNSMRHMGTDTDAVARLGCAIVRGLHDSGIFSIAKHYPGPGDTSVDTHMQEGRNDRPLDELLAYDLNPYFKMMDAGLLDGIMPGHRIISAVDTERIASLSKKVMGLLRDRGWDGVSLTDALSMMGVVLKYGQRDPSGMCIAAGSDLALPWNVSCEVGYEYLKEGYEKGLFNDEDLDTAVRHVLLAQHKANLLSEAGTAPEKKDYDTFASIPNGCVSAHYADGVTKAIPKDGHHLFVILTERDLKEDVPAPDAPPFANEWFYPHVVQDMVKAIFPNSDCTFLPEYPSAANNIRLFDMQIPYDSVVYITSHRMQAYLGRDCLTERVLAVMRALQSTNRISAVLHFGNPHVMDDVPRCDRFILGYVSLECVEHALHVLAGEAEATGTIPYNNVNLKL